MRFVLKSFSLNLPGGLGGVGLDLSEAAERAAWALYVELGTRVSTQELTPGKGSVREALSSLHALFGLVRGILRDGGVDVCRSGENRESVGTVAMRLLNEVIRPRLVVWHTSLCHYEAKVWQGMVEEGKCLPGSRELAGALVDEGSWPGHDEFYVELNELNAKVVAYIETFGALAGVVESRHVEPIGS